MWSNDSVARAIYRVCGLGLALLLIDRLVAKLLVVLTVLGICALVFGDGAPSMVASGSTRPDA